MDNNENTELELLGCPECSAPAEIVDRFDLPGTSGPVEHVKVQCLHRHWFTMATANLPGAGRAGTRTGTSSGTRTGTWTGTRTGASTGEEQVRWNGAA